MVERGDYRLPHTDLLREDESKFGCVDPIGSTAGYFDIVKRSLSVPFDPTPSGRNRYAT
jgi:hypothetical protein